MSFNSYCYDLGTLSLAQAIMMVTIKICLMITGLIVLSFGIDPSWSTLPTVLMVAATPMGTAIRPLSLRWVSKLWAQQLGLLIAIVGCVLCVWALFVKSFLLLNVGCFLVGLYSGFAWYYRYMAADIAPQSKQNQAISYIILAGVPAAILGPLLADHSRYWIHGYPFLATFIALALLNGGVMIFFVFAKLRAYPSAVIDTKETLDKIISTDIVEGQVAPSKKAWLLQGRFITGTVSTALCYLVMVQVMVATPMAMTKIYHFGLSSVALAMQLHFLGMFGTSIVTGRLMRSLGPKFLIVIGSLIYLCCTAVICSGSSPIHFYVGLLFLGIGWNFIFIAGTHLVVKSYCKESQNFLQGANNVITFTFSTLGALIAGPILFHWGWVELNLTVLPFCALLLLTTLWVHREKS